MDQQRLSKLINARIRYRLLLWCRPAGRLGGNVVFLVRSKKSWLSSLLIIILSSSELPAISLAHPARTPLQTLLLLALPAAWQAPAAYVPPGARGAEGLGELQERRGSRKGPAKRQPRPPHDQAGRCHRALLAFTTAPHLPPAALRTSPSLLSSEKLKGPSAASPRGGGRTPCRPAPLPSGVANSRRNRIKTR